MQILGKKLYSERELIDEVARQVNAPGSLSKKMLVYYRDVMGMVPKPIKLRATNRRGGAKSFYTEYALDSAKTIVKENKVNGETLKVIIRKYGDRLEENKIQSDILRQKCDFYIQAKNGISYSIDLKVTPEKGGSKTEIGKLDWLILTRAAGVIDAIKSKQSEEEVDKLLDDLQTFYQMRTKQRIAKQVAEGKGK